MIIDLSTPKTRAFVKQISTASLGDHSYIVVVRDEAVAIDIQRDLERFEAVLDGIDAELTAVFETHIHNDYVSGGKHFASEHGAVYVLPANTGATYEHTPLRDGETIGVGGWVVRALHTPGHTHNHTSYVLESPDGPVAIFSGGSMLVGAVGRSDLLGPDDTEVLLKGQYESAHRIADRLPDPSIVAPTHGTGSFCSASDVVDTTSTVGLERLRNPALIALSLEAFAMGQLMGYKQYPAYYKHMGASNLLPLGQPPAGDLTLITSLDDVGDAPIVDVRPFDQYARGHLPGSLSFPVSTDDAVYMGWTLPWDSPVILVGTRPEVDEVRTHLLRIGWDTIVGRIEPETLDLLSEADLLTMDVVTFADLPEGRGIVVDVRDPVEHLAGVIPGARLGHVADVARDPEAFSADEVFVHCQGGYRAAVAAGFIEATGATVSVVYDDLINYEGPLALPDPRYQIPDTRSQ
jgi:glyoxylase-like metal-dependent hydrolase (beta-lactamase superfamily II)/rhodanese-related sulfurtransferase